MGDKASRPIAKRARIAYPQIVDAAPLPEGRRAVWAVLRFRYQKQVWSLTAAGSGSLGFAVMVMKPAFSTLLVPAGVSMNVRFV